MQFASVRLSMQWKCGRVVGVSCPFLDRSVLRHTFHRNFRGTRNALESNVFWGRIAMHERRVTRLRCLASTGRSVGLRSATVRMVDGQFHKLKPFRYKYNRWCMVCIVSFRFDSIYLRIDMSESERRRPVQVRIFSSHLLATPVRVAIALSRLCPILANKPDTCTARPLALEL